MHYFSPLEDQFLHDFDELENFAFFGQNIQWFSVPFIKQQEAVHRQNTKLPATATTPN